MAELPPVLIIEDNDDHLYLTRAALEEAGLANPIHTASDIREARDCLQRATAGTLPDSQALPCLILLDLWLPDGSGMDFLREIRRDPALASLPVMTLMSSDDPHNIDIAYRLSATGYLIKPLKPSEFRRKAEEANIQRLLFANPASPSPPESTY